MPKFLQAQNQGAARVFAGIVTEGIAPGTWTIRCANGCVLTIPKSIFPLKENDQPSIMLGVLVTTIVEGPPPPGAN